VTDFYLLDEKLTDEEREIRNRLRAFGEAEVTPVMNVYWEKAEFPFELVPKIAALQLAGGTIEGYGCPGMSATAAGLVSMEWARADGSVGTFFGVHSNLAMQSIAMLGSEQQKQRWLPAMADLDAIGAFALTEPDHGSDAVHLETRARRDGDEWVLDGRKMWIGNGGIATVHVVNASVDPELGTKGQALFVVPGGAPGLRLVRKLEKLGCRASHTAELRFDGCRVPADHLLGGDERLERRLEKARSGEGRSATLGAIEQTRPMVAAQALGVARAAFEFACEYAGEREAFGEPILEKQGIAFPLAGLAADLDAARLMTWRASWMAAAGIDFHLAEGSMSKLLASEVAVRATERAVQVCGGFGYIRDLPVEKWYRDAKLYTIFEGTSEIQRLVIGRTLGEAPEGPLHHRLPGKRGPGRLVGRGSFPRSRAAVAALRLARRTPRSLLKLPGKIVSPPGSRN
jgi:acyl-CoA dehydrogenase